MDITTGAEVVVVGVGGLGTPCVWGLIEGWQSSRDLSKHALEIHLIDHEIIELSNLNRQVLFSESEVGLPKGEVLKDRLGEIVPDQGVPYQAKINIHAHQVRLTRENIGRLLPRNGLKSCFVVDATDSVATKLLLNDFCVSFALPFCYAGVVAEHGQLLTVLPQKKSGDSLHEKFYFSNSACLRCLFGDFSEEDLTLQSTSCQQAGILGPAAGYLGFLQAGTVLQYFLQLGVDKEPAPQFFRFALSDPASAAIETFSPEGPLPINISTVSPSFRPAPDCPLGCGLENRIILDLNGERCPHTFLYTKLAFEQLPGEAILDIRFDSEDSARNVAKSCQEEGYHILREPREIASTMWKLIVASNKE